MLLGLVAAASAATFDHPPADLRVGFGDDWTWAPGGDLLDGQLVAATHTPTGGGAIVRADPFDPAMVPALVREQVGDVDAAVSGDLLAKALVAGQTDGSHDRTVYLGLSDVAGPRIGRWVLLMPADGDEPERLWWHATWRTATHVAQLVAWAPSRHAPAFTAAMRALEPALGSVSGREPPATLLHRHNGACDGPASLDRMAAVAASASFPRAKAALASGDWTPAGRTVAELRAIGLLLGGLDACVPVAARRTRACDVWERDSDSPRSAAIAAAATACLDADRSVQRALTGALTPR